MVLKRMRRRSFLCERARSGDRTVKPTITLPRLVIAQIPDGRTIRWDVILFTPDNKRRWLSSHTNREQAQDMVDALMSKALDRRS